MKEVRLKKGTGAIGFADLNHLDHIEINCGDNEQIVLEGDTEIVSDGFHTFDELYRHRHLLFLALMCHEVSWISKQHNDGTAIDGWFLAGVVLPQTGVAAIHNLDRPFDDMEMSGTGYQQITYHLPLAYWDKAVGTGANVLEKAPKWDGHTSQDVVERLTCFVELG